MDTLLLDGNHRNDIERAGELLRAGEVVGIPTETVYGLAANALNSEAVKKIFAAKGRPADNPLIVHISDISQWKSLVREIPEAAMRLAEAFWPGPLTVILEKSDIIPLETSGGLSTVGVRFPAHPIARAVISAAGVPLAAPSANRSGKPSPTTFDHLKEDMNSRVAALLDGGDCGVGVESTVITLAGGKPRLLRPGGITLAQLESVLGHVEVDPAVLDKLKEGVEAASPGMKYKHYAPGAEVFLVDASPVDFADHVNQNAPCHALCFDEDVPMLAVPYLSYGARFDRAAQAQHVFSALHKLDELGAEKVFAHMPSKSGMGLAVYNRLIRAAAFRVVHPEKPYIIGLTGQTGAGKSTVGERLSAAGLAVIDCDKLTRSESVYNSECIAELQKAFGDDVAPDGVLDRRTLAARAFADSESKARLEKITFPRILSAVRGKVKEAADRGCKVIVLDAPTLFEAGFDRECAAVLVVTAPQTERVARIKQRDGLTDEQAMQRLSAQHEESFYTERADWVIVNCNGCDISAEIATILDELDRKDL